MRKVFAGIALIVASLSVLWSPAEALNLSRDFVKGAGEHQGADPPYPVIDVRIRARSDANGTDPRGRVVVANVLPLASYRGRVTCLNVHGTRATIGIEIVHSTDASLIGKGELWSVADANASDEPDGIAGYPITSTPPVLCPRLTFTVPVISGDYVVHAAPN